MKASSVIGILTLGGLFFYFKQRQIEGNGSESIDGINVDLNPEKITDSLIDSTNMSPLKKEMIRTGAKSFLKSYNKYKIK